MAKTTYKLDHVCVLIVEDNAFALQLITSILRNIGVGRVLPADSVKDAKELLSLPRGLLQQSGTAGIDLIIADWFLQKETAEELLTWTRQHETDAIRYVPFVVMSGYAEVDLVFKARDMGIDEFLAKPMSVASVCAKLLAVIDQRRPFLLTEQFFGPDRRRKARSVTEERRQASAEEAKPADVVGNGAVPAAVEVEYEA
jgi:two-component system, chemotaxis family, chemotaxis protein CheY